MYTPNEWRTGNRGNLWGRRINYGTISNRINERESYHDLVRAEGMGGSHAAVFERYYADLLRRSPSVSSRSDEDALETMPYTEEPYSTSADSEMPPVFDVRKYCSRTSDPSSAWRKIINTLLILFATAIVYATTLFCICAYLQILGCTFEVISEIEPEILFVAAIFPVMLLGMLFLQILDGEDTRSALLHAFMVSESAVWGVAFVISMATGIMICVGKAVEW